MPRKLRIFVPGGIYHVYCRVVRGERVFEERSEVERWVDTVAFVTRLHDLSILAWCLMSNHYHLVVRAGARARAESRPPRLRPGTGVGLRAARGASTRLSTGPPARSGGPWASPTSYYRPRSVVLSTRGKGSS